MEKKELIFENVIENISDGILTMGLDGTILLANSSAVLNSLKHLLQDMMKILSLPSRSEVSFSLSFSTYLV